MALKDMTADEKREYQKQRQQQNAAARTAREQREREREAQICESFQKRWGEFEDTLEALEDEGVMRLTLAALGEDARRIVLLLALSSSAGARLIAEVQCISGLKPASFKKVIEALKALDLLIPDLGDPNDDDLYGRAFDHFTNHGECYPSFYGASFGHLWMFCEGDRGLRVNEAARKLLVDTAVCENKLSLIWPTAAGEG